MGSFIIFLIGKGVPAKVARPLAYVLLAVLILAALGVGKCAYDRSVIAKHDAAQQVKIERDKAAQVARERVADANRDRQRQADEAAAAERTKEIDNATRNIPDQAPSARQRARACVELRRQAASSGRPPPAC